MTPDRKIYPVVTLRQRPGTHSEFWPQKLRIWPEFMLNDVYGDKLWHYLSETFDDHQLYLMDDDKPIAVGQTIPLAWDGALAGLPVGWADCLVRGTDGYEAGRAPDTLAGLEAAIQPEYQGMGVSSQIIGAMRDLAKEKGYKAVILAVRPSLKERYPITPMERYVHWQRPDGAPFDPWLRVHWRLGGEILKIALPSMVIEGTADEWEAWTGMQFPDSGDYVVPGALSPIHIDRTINRGLYVEPNVWVHHPITTERLRPPL